MTLDKLISGVKFSFDIDEVIEIPLRVCDLAIISSFAISIYSMDSLDDKPIASTVIDLFDSKRCLR